MPNVVTPNGDGENDYFSIETKGYVGAMIHIYGRWGNEVYESSDLDFKWYGTKVNDGVYYYTLSLKKIDHTMERKKGTVQLIR